MDLSHQLNYIRRLPSSEAFRDLAGNTNGWSGYRLQGMVGNVANWRTRDLSDAISSQIIFRFTAQKAHVYEYKPAGALKVHRSLKKKVLCF